MTGHISLHSANLKKNIQSLKSILPQRYKFVGVVKGNAYGHGLREIVSIIKDSVDGFQIDDLDDLVRLREVTQKQAYVFGFIDKESLEEAMKLSCVISIFDKDRLADINRIATKLDITQEVHIKIDALVGRLGLFKEELSPFVSSLKQFTNIKVTGIYSHFTAIKDRIDYEHTDNQINLFMEAHKIMNENGYVDLEVHMSSSSGVFIPQIVNNPLFNMVRVGKAMYGIWPSRELKKNIDLSPVISWKTKIAQIKTFPKGYTIGYNAVHKTTNNTVAAIIPQGYSDGYDKKISKSGEVLISGKRCKILGKVAMNMFLADVSGIRGLKQGDEVVILGKQGDKEITIGEIGENTEATACEVLAKISPLLSRVIV